MGLFITFQFYGFPHSPKGVKGQGQMFNPMDPMPVGGVAGPSPCRCYTKKTRPDFQPGSNLEIPTSASVPARTPADRVEPGR